MRVRALVNGRIYSSFKPIRVHEAMVTAGKNIVYVGSSEKAERLASHMDGEVVDLEGRAVLPGFIDVHMHVDNLGLALSSLDLRGTGSIRELKERLRRYYEEHRGASWILGRGWDQELFEEKRWPTRWDLDEAVSDKPVLLVRICGHAAVANTKALELAGLLDNPPDDPNVRRDEEGRPTGLLVEDAIMQVRSRISFTDEELEAMVEKALWHAASLGVTTLGFVSCSPRVLSMLERIRLRLGRLPVRIRAYLSREAAEPLLELGVRRGFGNEYLKIMGVKLFTDGSLGARTAWLSEPYDDDPSTSGIPVIGEEELGELARKISGAGLQLAIHAIGDRANDMVLRIYSELGREAVRGLRHRIEHASVLRPDQLRLMAELGAAAAVQPHFIISDWWVVRRLGRRRASWAYPLRTMATAGIPMGFSTDAPVEPLDPWETIYAAVTRGEYEGVELAAETPGERLGLEESLHYYTMGSAYLVFEEERLGSLEPGKLADYIVVDRDPLVMEPPEIRGVKVLETVVGGEIVYRAAS